MGYYETQTCIPKLFQVTSQKAQEEHHKRNNDPRPDQLQQPATGKTPHLQKNTWTSPQTNP